MHTNCCTMMFSANLQEIRSKDRSKPAVEALMNLVFISHCNCIAANFDLYSTFC